MPVPKYGVAYTFARGLFDTANAGHFKSNPTIAAGDFRLSKDGGALANLTNLPTVSPAGSPIVVFSLTAAEMTAARVTLVGIDQAGNEWGDLMEHLAPTTQTIEDVPTAVQTADALLVRDWTAVVGSAPAYCVLQALRLLRNVWSLVAGTPPVLHVKAEDGVTDAWVRPVTTSTTAPTVTGVS